MTDDQNTIRIKNIDLATLYVNDYVYKPPVITDPQQDQLEAAMAEDGTGLAESGRFGMRARIDFAEDGTMYVLFPASGIVRRYKPEP